jgi:uncharacterized surface protein with fasciclin (FAS1) repeats
MQRRFFLCSAGALALSACGGGGDAGNPLSLDEVAGITNNRSIAELVAASPDTRTLQDALNVTGLTPTFDDDNADFTVFAPTDDAFEALLTELGLTRAELFANTALLTQVLTYHMVQGTVRQADIPIDTPITTLEGDTFTISPALAITDQRGRAANITTTDLEASNGVVHLIDRVLLPAA